MGLDPKLRARVREGLENTPTSGMLVRVEVLLRTNEKIKEIAERHDTTMQSVVELAIDLLDDIDKSRI